MSVAAGRLRWASVSVGDWTEGGDRLAAGRHHLLGTKQLRGAEQAGCVHQDPQLHPVDTGQHQAAGLRVEQTQSFGNIKTGFRNLNINVVICICMDLLISNILLYNDILCFFFIFWEIVDDRLEGPVCLSESEMSDQIDSWVMLDQVTSYFLMVFCPEVSIGPRELDL